MRMLTLVVIGASLLSASITYAEADEVGTGLRLSVRDGRLLLVGAAFMGDQKPTVVRDGPIPGVGALVSSGGAQVITLKLNRPIGEQACISFWFRTDTWYQSGIGRETVRRELLEITGIGKCYFVQDAADCLLGWDWEQSRVKGVDWMGTYIPELPGPEWYHLVYTWDAKRGLFDAYINGIPQRMAGINVKPWEMRSSDYAVLHLGPICMADVTIEHDYLPPEQVARDVPIRYRGRRAEILGVYPHRKLPAIEKRRGRLLYECALDENSVKDWVMEGPGIVSFEDGWMRISSPLVDGEPKGHIVYWCPKDFPNRFIAEWETQILSSHGLCIVFFAAKGVKGEDIFDKSLPPRDGTFQQYTVGRINSYHISYYANTPNNPGRSTSNLRKNSGFYLIANGPPGIPAGDTNPHKVRLIKDDARIMFEVDGHVIIDYTDDGKRYGSPHGGGKIGFRQMQWTVARYRNLRVWELKPAESATSNRSSRS